MKIRFEHNGTVFEFERQPLPESRFKAVCAIVAAGIYVGMVTAVTALCGIAGIAIVAFVTLFAVMMYLGAK